MVEQTEPNRWHEIRDIQKEHSLFYKALPIGLGVLIGGALFGDSGYITNLWTEGLSVALTILVLNTLAEHREGKRRIKDLQERLVMEAGSRSNEAAKRAVDELRARGWLTGDDGLLKRVSLQDSKLQGANLMGANLQWTLFQSSNLQEANLVGANLQRAHLQIANVQEGDLMSANLQGAILSLTNLQRARLWTANIQKADLSYSNLYRADMLNANLQGARLEESNLQEAELQQVNMDETTILPDGTHWTPDTDLTRFTDPNHPNFWRSDDPVSPAYRGN